MESRLKVSLILGGIALALVLAVKYLLPIVAPFVLGLFLSCLAEPVIAFLQTKIRIPRRVAVPIVLLLAFVIIGCLLTFGVARIYVELKRLLSDLPVLISIGEEAVRKLERFFSTLPPQIGGMLQGNISRVGGLVEGLVKGAMDMAGAIPGFLLTLTIGAITSFFISRDKERILAFFFGLAPTGWRRSTASLKTEIFNSAMSYVRAQLLLVALTTVLGTVLMLIIGVQHALVLGLALGVLDLLPMVGPSALFFPWIAYHFLAGSGWYGLLLAGVFLVLQITRQIAESSLVGERLGVHPLAALLAVWAGIKVFGTLGFVFGPLILIVMKAVARGIEPIMKQAGVDIQA